MRSHTEFFHTAIRWAGQVASRGELSTPFLLIAADRCGNVLVLRFRDDGAEILARVGDRLMFPIGLLLTDEVGNVHSMRLDEVPAVIEAQA